MRFSLLPTALWLLLSLSLLLLGVADARRRRTKDADDDDDDDKGRSGPRWSLGMPSWYRADGDSWWNRWFGNPGRKNRFNFGGPESPFSFNFGWNFGRQRDWWEGPNVCYREEVDNSTEASEAGIITHHFKAASQVCEESVTAYRCKSKMTDGDGQMEKVQLYECCHGYSRKPGDFGCPEKLELADLRTTASKLGLNDFLEALSSVGLEEQLGQGNFTIFAPADGAFPLPAGPGLTLQGDEQAIRVSDSTLTQVEKELQTVLLGHMLPEARKASSFSDEDVIATGSPVGSTIRINFYSSPEKMTTANCVRVTSTDHMVTNGVIHTVEKVLPTVTSSIMEIIQREAEFSTLKTALARANLVSTLKGKGQWTLFAPTNAAMQKLDKKFMEKLMNGDPECLQKVLKQHILPNVICSAVMQGRVKTRNALDNYLNISRSEDNKTFVDDAQMIRADVMATNGVMHVIDKVLIPDDALDLVTMAKKAELTEFVKLVQAAGMMSTLQNANNVTVFAPSNDAIKALPEDIAKQLTSDPARLGKVLAYHVIPKELTCRELFSGSELETLTPGTSIRINEYFSFPFRQDNALTVQCAKVIGRNMPACNGIVHIIDRVMIPPTGNVIDVMSVDSKFSTMLMLLKNAGLADGLQAEGPFTIFAPTNEAFKKLGKQTMKELEGDRDRLTEILKLHIVQGMMCCGGIFETMWWHQQHVRSLGGQLLSLARDRSGSPYINDAAISRCDNMAVNGLVHAINEVLLPRYDPWFTFK